MTSLGVSGWRLHGQRTGVGRYTASLVEHFTPDVIQDRFASINVYTPYPFDLSSQDVSSRVRNPVIPSRLPMVAWDNLRLGPSVLDDVVLYPSFARPLVTRGASVVVTHDATMKVVPDMFSRRDRVLYGPLYGWSARAATLVITTSEAAKRDIVRVWDVDPAKIRVTPLAAAGHFRPLSQPDDRDALRKETLGDATPFFMFVGKISGRRNVPELLRAFVEFKRGGYPHKLLVVGPTHAVEAVKVLGAELGVGDNLMTRSYVTDETLNQLYNCAEAFIMPSAYENGSLPVFEAQATGTPVISVHTEGTEEITGGAALLIPRLDAAELVRAMTTLASDLPLRRELSAKGLANSALYSWSRCARETLEVCREAVEVAQA
jgi:glycosyltransferase involved in cell wall biosynthesis